MNDRLPIPPLPPPDAPATINYDEAAIPPYETPEVLRFADGRPVVLEDWQARRREMLDVLASEMYGREPPPPEAFEWEVIEEGPTFGGLGIRRQCRVWFRKDRTGPYLDWLVLLPNRPAGMNPIVDGGRVVREASSPAPVILFLNYHGNHALLDDPEVVIPDNVWVHISESRQDGTFALREGMRAFDRRTCDRRTFPAETILARGYAIMSCCYGQISPDVEVGKGDPLDLAWTGVFDLWGRRDPQSPDEPTALGAWAWALSRGLDLAERQPEIDASRAIVTGSSRLGKSALLAGARDERFAVVAPNQTGGGGAPLAKRFFGENVFTEIKAFPHWYCPAYRRYAENESAMPFDQHWLLACVAPRALLVEGFGEAWFDAKGEFLACRAASPAWELHGLPGMPPGDFPKAWDESFIGQSLGYVWRGGLHGLSAYDWNWMIDFAERRW
ncbi:MAG: hypothetical protein IJT64_00875 [Kiritimatiellae bacterium]|nr:hypothetical protein [Kiritimatiellia bacterium]